MTHRSSQKRPPRSLRKFFRAAKARLRRDVADGAAAEEKIRDLLVKHWPQYHSIAAAPAASPKEKTP